MAREKKFTTEELYQTTRTLLLQHGYEGFTFSLLAENLKVSRGTLYKYYENKEELITEFMLYEMKVFLDDLKEIHKINGFKAQLDFLLSLMFKNFTIHQLIEIGQRVPAKVNQKVKANHEKLEKMHLNMYDELQAFIEQGRQEKILREDLPDGLILGFIFQSISIPNHAKVAQDKWVLSIKDILCYGMFEKNN